MKSRLELTVDLVSNFYYLNLGLGYALEAQIGNLHQNPPHGEMLHGEHKRGLTFCLSIFLEEIILLRFAPNKNACSKSYA